MKKIIPLLFFFALAMMVMAVPLPQPIQSLRLDGPANGNTNDFTNLVNVGTSGKTVYYGNGSQLTGIQAGSATNVPTLTAGPNVIIVTNGSPAVTNYAISATGGGSSGVPNYATNAGNAGYATNSGLAAAVTGSLTNPVPATNLSGTINPTNLPPQVVTSNYPSAVVLGGTFSGGFSGVGTNQRITLNTRNSAAQLLASGANESGFFWTNLFQQHYNAQGMGICSDGTNLILGFNGNCVIVASNDYALSNYTGINHYTQISSNYFPGYLPMAGPGGSCGISGGGMYYGAIGGRPAALYFIQNAIMCNGDDLHSTNVAVFSLDPKNNFQSNGFWELTNYSSLFNDDLNGLTYCPVTGLMYASTQANGTDTPDYPGPQCSAYQNIAVFNPTNWAFLGFLSNDVPFEYGCALCWSPSKQAFLVAGQDGPDLQNIFTVDLNGHTTPIWGWDEPEQINGLIEDPFKNSGTAINTWILIDGYPSGGVWPVNALTFVGQINLQGTNAVMSVDDDGDIDLFGSSLGNIFNDGSNLGFGTGANRWMLYGEGTANIAIGEYANESLSNATQVIAIGTTANHLDVSGGYNIAIGFRALEDNLAAFNQAVGVASMANNTTGTGNLADGYSTLEENRTGNNNTAVGFTALFGFAETDMGSENTAVGQGAGYSVGMGSYNEFMGSYAGYAVTTGGSDILIGWSAGSSLTSGSYNTIIGRSAGANYTGPESSDVAILAPGVAGENNNGWLGTYGTNNGQQTNWNVGPGVTLLNRLTIASSNQLQFSSDGPGSGIFWTKGNGSIYEGSASSSYPYGLTLFGDGGVIVNGNGAGLTLLDGMNSGHSIISGNASGATNINATSAFGSGTIPAANLPQATVGTNGIMRVDNVTLTMNAMGVIGLQAISSNFFNGNGGGYTITNIGSIGVSNGVYNTIVTNWGVIISSNGVTVGYLSNNNFYCSGTNTAGYFSGSASNLTSIPANQLISVGNGAGGTGNFFTGNAGNATMTGSYNTAFGSTSLFDNTTGANNTAIGSWALVNNGAGARNTAIGYSALYFNSSGAYNTANGYSALYYNTKGNNNTADGASALYNSTNSYNIGIGYQAGSNILGPSNCIYIGNTGLVTDTNNIIRIGQGQSNCYVAGTVTSTGGYASTANGTYSVGATGITNIWTNTIKIPNFAGGSVVYSNANSATTATLGTVASQLQILGIGDSLSGTGCSGNGFAF